MGAQQGNNRIISQIGDDIGTVGFDGDDMLDMQTRIGSYSSLQRRLTGEGFSNVQSPNKPMKIGMGGKHTKEDLFNDLQSD